MSLVSLPSQSRANPAQPPVSPSAASVARNAKEGRKATARLHLDGHDGIDGTTSLETMVVGESISGECDAFNRLKLDVNDFRGIAVSRASGAS
ncbi:unnamed protein product, partial [Aphanomyces euteiches]